MSLSYVHGASRAPLLHDTIGATLERTATRFPDAEALVTRHEGQRLTYGALNTAVNAVARGLLARGVERGDRVGIWSPNRADWVLIQYAAAKVGAILVNISPAYRVAELEYVLNQSGTSLLIAATAFKTSDYVAMAEQARPNVPQLRAVVHFDSSSWLDLLAAAERIPEDRLRHRIAQVQFDAPANIQYTSGTTGTPKGATLSHHNLINNAFFIGEALRYTERDRLCLPLPFYHSFAMVVGNLACATHGACVVIPEASFDVPAILEAIDAERCTSLYGVPTMFIAELQHPDFDSYDLRSLRTGVMAGAPCPVEVMKQVIERMHMKEVAIIFGMTETSAATTITALDDSMERRVTSVGRILPHTEVKIVDDEGRIVPRGEPGEILTRGYCVMLEYWNDPQRTAEAIDQARWMHTGDLGTIDEDGYFNIVGRSKEMIIRGGENLFPREIEEFLHTHPDVVDVAVIGVPDAHYGEELMAWIVPNGDHSLSEDEVKDYCRGRIAHFKIPRYVKFTTSLPTTVTGKIKKRELRDKAIEELQLESAAAIRTA